MFGEMIKRKEHKRVCVFVSTKAEMPTIVCWNENIKRMGVQRNNKEKWGVKLN